MSDENSEKAEVRTRWAEDRTLLANERTFSSWMGTGLGCVGLAVGMHAVFGAVEPTWLAKLAATTFIMLSLILFYVACSNACKARIRLNSHSAEPASNRAYQSISLLSACGAIVTGIVLWMV